VDEQDALIDLDAVRDPAPARRNPAWRAGVAGLALGGVLGALVTYQWHVRRTQAAEASVVSVVVLADQSGWLGDGARTSAVTDRRVAAVRLSGHVAVVNTGPAPIKLVGLAVDRPGLTLRDTDGERWIKPAGSTFTRVQAEARCAAGGLGAEIRGSFSAETRTGSHRTVPVTFQGALWRRQIEQACAKPAPVIPSR
jgi:hypothetical protein